MALLGKLEKMKLIGYSDISFSEAKKLGSYEVLINPESYALTYGVLRADQTPQGLSSGQSTYNHTTTQRLTFKFLFDGTGVIQSGNVLPSVLGASNKMNVAAELDKFKSFAYGYQSDTHQPPFLQLRWGALHFNCTLETMTVTFKLFNPDGNPLRADAECTFLSAIDLKTLTELENKNSPDLTHMRTVKDGDTLPLLCYREYGDSKYYYEVAKYNRISDFKTLTPGTIITFPPFAN